MFILDLFEEINLADTLVVYPGRFQPWHKGHRAVYDYLVSNFGRDRVSIATSNKVDPPRSPFSFSEKLQFMHLTGISADSVIETRDPYKVPELVGKVDAARTRIIFAVSQKDMNEDPRFKFGTKKDGTPTYFQPMPKDTQQMQSLDKHGYIMVVPTFNFTVLGQPMTSATQVRAQFAQANDETQQAIIKDLFGSYSREIHQIMKNKIALNEGQAVRLEESTGQVLDLTKNFSNHARVHAKVVDVLPSGKVKLQVVAADTISGKKPTVSVGQTLSMALNYLRRAPQVDKSSSIAETDDYEYLPPGAGAAQTRNVIAKTKQKIAGPNKFIWKKPNQFGGSRTEQQLLQLGFKKSAFGAWGGTQAMWNRLTTEGLNEFAPGAGGGESGRWYTDDQMTDIVGDGWWNDLDISGNIPKQAMIQEAQAWLDDQGYNVRVLNCKLNDDDMEWYIEGSFNNPNFAKKGMEEALGGKALSALQQAKQSIAKNREADVAAWEQDFRKNFAAKYGSQMPAAVARRPLNIPSIDPAPKPMEKHSVLKSRMVNLNAAIEKQKYLDYLTFKTEQKGLLNPRLAADIDTSLYVKGAEKDNYQALNQKLDKAIELIKNRLGVNKLAYKKSMKAEGVAEGIEEDPLDLRSDYALHIADAGRMMMTQLTNLAKKIQTDSAAAQNAKRWNLGDYMHQHYETDDLNAINQVFEEYGVGGFFDQNLYKLLANWSSQGTKYVTTWKQYSSDVIMNSNRKPGAQSVHEQVVAEDAAGVGVVAKNKKMAKDPRYSMSMTQDVKPGQDVKNMRALRLTK